MVRQALLQTQTPEIQAKLLAMQKHMVSQRQDGVKTVVANSSASTVQATITAESKLSDSLEAKAAKPKTVINLSVEQKEEHLR